jgi:hypothetical protein
MASVAAPQPSQNYNLSPNVALSGSVTPNALNRPPANDALGALRDTPSALDRLRDTPSTLEMLVAQPTLVASAQQARATIRVQAPVQNGFSGIDNSRYIEISVRPLQPSELGSLNKKPADIPQVLADAAVRMNRENLDTYRKSTRELRSDAIDSGYFNSPAHQAWAQAAEARTGGRVPASWWRENDPFGGTAGNGPQILPQGSYPGSLSKIAMGHDTDWTLGNQFGAGPLRGLQTMGGTAEERGKFGLEPFDSRLTNTYTTGHPDWTVNYTNPW